MQIFHCLFQTLFSFKGPLWPLIGHLGTICKRYSDPDIWILSEISLSIHLVIIYFCSACLKRHCESKEQFLRQQQILRNVDLNFLTSFCRQVNEDSYESCTGLANTSPEAGPATWLAPSVVSILGVWHAIEQCSDWTAKLKYEYHLQLTSLLPLCRHMYQLC